MKNFNVRTVSDGAAVTALTVILLTAGRYVPVLGSAALLISGVPLAYYIIRWGTGAAVTALAAVLALIFALTGNFISGPLSALISLLPAIAAGNMMRRRAGYYYVLLAAVAAALIGYVADVMLLNHLGGGNGVKDMLDESVNMVKTMIEPYLSQADASGELIGLFADALKQGRNMIISFFPTILIVISAVSGYVITAVIIFFMARLRVVKYPYINFWRISLPRGTAFAAVVFMVISYLCEGGDVVSLAIQNLSALLLIALAVVGLASLDFRLRLKIQSGYARAAVYLVAALMLYLFMTFIFYILVFAGMLDSNLDLRMLRRAGGSSEDK